MRVCHFVASVGLGRGDAFVELANAQSAHAEVCLLAPKGAKFASALNPRVRLVEYKRRNSRMNPALYLELWRIFRNLKPEVVHTHFAKATEIFYQLNRFLGLVWVATKHNPRKGKVYNKVKNVIAVSEGVSKSICCPNVEVIFNGIRPVEVQPMEMGNPFRIIAIGRLEQIKGFDRLVSAASKLDFEFILEIVGEGVERQSLQRLISDLGLSEKVKLLGFRKDIPQLLAQADLQVMSSHSEGFSLAMVEAIFYSRVFVSTRVSGCIEVLDPRLIMDGDEIAGKIMDVYRNYPAFKELFSDVKSRFSKLLHIDTVAARHLDYYRRLLDGE